MSSDLEKVAATHNYFLRNTGGGDPVAAAILVLALIVDQKYGKN